MDKAKTCTFIGHKDSYGINPELLKAEIVKLIDKKLPSLNTEG